jgi:hypothetical protein
VRRPSLRASTPLGSRRPTREKSMEQLERSRACPATPESGIGRLALGASRIAWGVKTYFPSGRARVLLLSFP